MIDDPPEVKFLTLEEANALLPEIESKLKEMDRLTARRDELSDLLEDIEAYWGDGIQEPANPDHEKYLQFHSELAEVNSAVNDCMVHVNGLGGHLKSYEQGLVDFYSVRDGKLVFLCWKRGEGRIEYYHELDSGFRGRRPTSP